jgi:O-antigen/teichoic acid export membrane protein
MYKEFIKLIKNTMVYGAGDVVSKAIGFFMIPVYTRFLTPSDYGVISLLMLFTTFVSIIASLGMSQAIMRIYYEGENDRERHTIYTTSLIFIGAIGVAVVSVLSKFSVQISQVLFSAPGYSRYVSLILLALFFQLLSQLPRTLLVAKEKPFFYTAASIGTFVIGMSLNIYLIAILKLGVLGFVYSSLITSAITATALILFTLPKGAPHFSFKWLREMLRFGFPLVFSSLTMFIYMFSDRFFIEKLYSLAAVGLYSLAVQFGDIITYATSPFFTARTPFIFSRYKEKNAKEMFSRLFTYSSLIFCFVGLGLSVYIRDIFSIVVGKDFFSAYKLVPILILGILFRAGSHSLCIGIAIMKKNTFTIYISSVAAIMNILLLVFLVPRFGALGAAVSRTITFLIILLLGYEISQRLYHIKYEFRRIAHMAILAL